MNTEDYALLDQAMAQDVEVHYPGMAVVRGREAAKAQYARLLAGYPEHVDDVTRFLVDGDSVVAEIDFRGVAEAGQVLRFTATDVFDLVDGRIAKVRISFDTHAVRRMLTSGGADGRP